MIAVKVFLVIFRPVHFYQTPHILNLAFIVKNTYVQYTWLLSILVDSDLVRTDTHTDTQTNYLARACAEG